MKDVLVYVEGPSDVRAMEQLFGGLIAAKCEAGVSIRFFPAREGDRKKNLLTRTPKDAARLLKNNPQTFVVIVPDLYPPNKGFDHKTFDEMRKGAEDVFADECRRIAPGEGRSLHDRFKVFCFKHDLEVLILACPEGLKYRLGATKLRLDWCNPAEDQNHDDPPKAVVKRLFSQHGDYYAEVADAPIILANCDYLALAEACPQCFKPFVEFLENL